MKKRILIYLVGLLLTMTVGQTAEARVAIGLGPSAPSDAQSLSQLEQELTRSAGTAVQARAFKDPAALANWLLRFREIEAAVVPPGFIDQQPAGTLTHLLDLHPLDSRQPLLALTTLRTLDAGQVEQIRNAFLALNKTPAGQQALKGVGLFGVTPPGQALKRPAVEAKPLPAPTPPPPKPEVKQAVTPKPPVKQQKPVEKPPVEPEAKPEPQQKPEIAPPATKSAADVPVAEKESPAAPITEPAEQAPAPQPATEKSPEPPVAAEPAQPGGAPATASAPEPDKPSAVAPPVIEEPAAQAPAPPPKSAPSKRLILFVILIILTGILFKIGLILLRWKSSQQQRRTSQEIPSIEEKVEPKAVLPKPQAEVLAAPDDEEHVIEAGHLGPGKVPELLKRCADLPRPVVLKVKKGACEKFIYFAAGQVAGAQTQNSTTEDSGIRWDKLGSLLVREQLISGEERDQGMALLNREPHLRLGEALLKLGFIDLSGLRHALTRQAKVTIYSLILFPEGRYEVIAGDNSLPAEESVALEVSNLIREASQHQAEWTAIRQALPNLNKVLDFTLAGREKLENVSLAPQQQATLQLVDGKRTINDICAESSLMDYEVYRFLYLMIKANVIHLM